MFHFWKFLRTLRILWCLGCARTFGEYVHSGWDGFTHSARYKWRGREWIIPTSPVEGEFYRQRRFGFKSRKQLPLFMIWEEECSFGEVVYARVLFSTSDVRQKIRGLLWRS